MTHRNYDEIVTVFKYIAWEGSTPTILEKNLKGNRADARAGHPIDTYVLSDENEGRIHIEFSCDPDGNHRRFAAYINTTSGQFEIAGQEDRDRQLEDWRHDGTGSGFVKEGPWQNELDQLIGRIEIAGRASAARARLKKENPEAEKEAREMFT